MQEWIANTLQSLLDFSHVLNTSISASWLVLAVMILRFLLKKAPKWSHVALWGLVAVRLLLPFSIESTFSLIPSTETLPREILTYEGTQANKSAHLEIVSNPTYPSSFSVELDNTVDRVQIHMVYLTLIWLAGFILLLLYTTVSYLILHRKIAAAVWYRDNIFQCEKVRSPFVFGIVHPRIYLPFQINGQNLEHVIAHEQAHVHRKDHWWKPLGFLLLTIHWFNPLMWLSFLLFCRDIELACDEKVIKGLGNEQRADYAQALLDCSVNRHTTAACPLSFGEVGVKERVKSIMNYKKPALWTMVLTVIVCGIAALCFLTNPPEPTIGDIISQDNYTVLTKDQVHVTLSIPKADLPDDIYTPAGHEFGENDVIVYQTDTTTIYLYKIMLSNESDDLLYFLFDFSYDFSSYGKVLSPKAYNGKGFRDILQLGSKALRDNSNIYPDALSMRGHGPGCMFAFYVSVDACKAAGGNILIDVICDELIYAKNKYESQAAKLITAQ